jgi:hypothetical protein
MTEEIVAHGSTLPRGLDAPARMSAVDLVERHPACTGEVAFLILRAASDHQYGRGLWDVDGTNGCALAVDLLDDLRETFFTETRARANNSAEIGGTEGWGEAARKAPVRT